METFLFYECNISFQQKQDVDEMPSVLASVSFLYAYSK